MMKFRITRAITVAFAILIGLGGCKKEDDELLTSTFKLTGDSFYFEYGQQKRVGFTTHRVQKVEVSSVVKGWECSVVGQEIVITAPATAGTGSEQRGTIEVTATTVSDSKITNKITVAIKYAEKIEQPANCFVVTEPGKRMRFDATIKGDGTKLKVTPVDAKLLWVSIKGAVSHVSFEDGYIYFASQEADKLTEANGVVAAIDAEGNVVWSWHIWCVADDPRLETVEMEGMKVMSRNLGATRSILTSGSIPADTLACYGLYYQWGRKDPFVGPDKWNSSAQHYLFDGASKHVKLSYEATSVKTGTIEYATANPMTFITGTEDSQWDWLFDSRNNSLWGNANSANGVTDSKGTKSTYDPCPAGWMVAPPKIWKSFTTTGAATEDPTEFNVRNNATGNWVGWIFGNLTSAEVYYPAAGRRSFSITKSDGNYVNIINLGFGEKGRPVGFYWSNSNSSATAGAFLSFTDSFINPSSSPVGSDSAYGARAGGFPVRCVEE